MYPLEVLNSVSKRLAFRFGHFALTSAQEALTHFVEFGWYVLLCLDSVVKVGFFLSGVDLRV